VGAARFAAGGRLRLRDALPEAEAQAWHGVLAQAGYALMLTRGGQGTVLTPDALAQLTPAAREALQHELHEAASQGVGFLYEGHQLRGSHDPALRAILAAVNAPETLERVRTLTGFGDITHADGQATRYRGGHFLTRHRDDLSGQARRVAYVLSLTARWHPDWGGLLQFFEDDGTPRDAWVPGWNVLSLFDVRHVHSVTYVAPFAGGPRLSVTGWFRAGPAPAP
jgi:hypothetical protein